MTVVNSDGSDVPIKNKRARVRMSITCVMQDIGIFSLVVRPVLSRDFGANNSRISASNNRLCDV
jgi:hypothetical protein